MGSALAKVVSYDRFLIKIVDRTVSTQDVSFQLRNLKALKCIYSDAIVLQYFGNDFIKLLEIFMDKMPEEDTLVKVHLHQNDEALKKIRLLFKMLRYTEDQKGKVSPYLSELIRENTKVNRCEAAVLYKDSLKTNFKNLLELELYLRSRYGGQLKSNNNKFDAIRGSIDLFMDSLDKQFNHEYYR